MKKLFTISFAFAGVLSFGQDLEIHENGVSISGEVITIDSAATADHTGATYYIVNKTSGSISVSWSRTRLAHQAPIWDQICDDILCFDAADATVYTRPTTMTIAAGDSSIFQPKVYPEGTPSCAIYTYKVFSGLGTFQDSIQVKYRFGGSDCFLDTPETPITYSVYPNPANNFLNIKLTSNGNSVVLNIYNIMGELVINEELVSGNNTISVADLSDGVYFYSIIKNNAIVETKKVVIKH